MDGMSSATAERIDFEGSLPEGEPTPFDCETVILSKRKYIELKARANFYQAEHARAKRKIERLQGRIEKLLAQLRDLRQRFFGRRTEKSAARPEKVAEASGETGVGGRAARGQRRGSEGHGRTRADHLPVTTEERDVSEQERCCEHCQKPLQAGPDRVSVIIEMVTVFFRRRVVRKTYRRCHCPGACQAEPAKPALIAPPAPGRLIRRGKYGVSVLVEVLVDKFLHSIPTHRQLQRWAGMGLSVSAGTITEGLKRVLPLMKPLMEAFKAQQLSESLFNADETFWRVFEKIAGKVNYRWYLWTFLSPSVCFYLLDPSRSAKVPLSHFGALLSQAILTVDRYSAYKKLPKTLSILLSFCWAHQRRDWVELARNYPPLQPYALQWINRIRTLYHLNRQRLKAGSAGFAAWDAKLRAHVLQMQRDWALGLADPKLHPAARKCLQSFERHWQGLVLFVDRPEIEMDNNRAERALRGAVVGRKNFYGSGAVWSAELAANLFTVLMTLVHCWKINPRRWLTEFLQACADHGGKAPSDLSNFLPWTVSPERLKVLRTPLPLPRFNTS